jgi:hypothetical protein
MTWTLAQIAFAGGLAGATGFVGLHVLVAQFMIPRLNRRTKHCYYCGSCLHPKSPPPDLPPKSRFAPPPDLPPGFWGPPPAGGAA